MSEKMTVSCGNVFEDLGFAPDEAAAMLARETLLIALEKELRKRGKSSRNWLMNSACLGLVFLK